MKLKAIVLLLVLIQPAVSAAAYKIYLKNGSVISGASSYETRGGEVIINFRGGSTGIPAEDILRIEETAGPETDFRLSGPPGNHVETPSAPATPVENSGNNAKATALRNELEGINSQLQSIEEQEARLTAGINEKIGARTRYTSYQIRQLESEIAPLKQELSGVQQKKNDLLQRKAHIEDELRGLE